MTVPLDIYDAVVELCERESDPLLSPEEVNAAITRTARATVWAPSTAYSFGARVVPTIPLGRTYICVLAGTSGATDPPWLIAPAYTGPVNPLGGAWWGAGVVPFIESVESTPWFWGMADGTAAWRDYGPHFGDIYDVRAAAAELWRVKARKVAPRYDVAVSGSVNAKRSQMYTNFMDQARALQPLRIA